jgi:DNA-binding LytR/AlgR family response regulator
MRILIVDDEAAARRRLASLLEEIAGDDVEIAGEADNGMTALDLVRTLRPDVILLDIAMPEVDGFDVARHLGSPRPLIIFQTAYREHALQAFEHEAIDYVVKPVRKDRLAQAIERARARLASLRATATWDASSLAHLGTAVGYQPSRPGRLLVRQGAGHRLTPVRDIIRFSAGDGVVYAHTPASRPIVDYTLADLELRLGTQFLRVSRADLVNTAHVVRITGNGDGSATLEVTGGAAIHVSRRRAGDVRRALER